MNFKRILSAVLAVIMVLGTMSTVTFAAEPGNCALVSPQGTIWGEASNVDPQTSLEIKVFAENTLLATKSLNDYEGIISGGIIGPTWTLYIDQHDANDPYWKDTWYVEYLTEATIPTHAELWVDGALINTCDVIMYKEGDLINPVKWSEVPGVKSVAIGEVLYDSITEALAEVSDGGTISLICDTEEANIKVDNKNVTIDLAGHTLTTHTASGDGIVVTNNATLTLMNSSETAGSFKFTSDKNGSDAIEANKGSVLNLEKNVTIIGSAMSNNLICANKGTINLNGTDIVVNGETNHDHATICLEEGSTLNMNSGTITIDATNTKTDMVSVSGALVYSDAVRAYFNGGTVSVDCANAKQSGFIISWWNGENDGLAVANGTEFIINSKNNGKGYAFLNDMAGTLVKTEFKNSTVTGNLIAFDEYIGMDGSSYEYTRECEVEVSGGTFPVEIPVKYVDEEFMLNDNGDGTFGVKDAKVVDVNGTKYTMAQAFEAANAGDTITLLDDVNLAGWTSVDVRKAITLDGNGKTITGLTAPLVNNASVDFAVKNLTVTDADIEIKSATGEDNDSSAAALVQWANGGKLNLNNVSVTDSTIKGDGYVAALVGFVDSTSAGVEVAGGTIKNVKLIAGGTVGTVTAFTYSNMAVSGIDVMDNDLTSTSDGGERPDKVGLVVGRVHKGDTAPPTVSVDATVDKTNAVEPVGDTNEHRIIGSIPGANTGAKVVITGGSYPTDPTVTGEEGETAECAEDFKVIKESDGSYSVKNEVIRTFTLVTSKSTVKAGESFDITVVYDGQPNIVRAEWRLNYDPDLFECEADTDEYKGTIYGVKADPGIGEGYKYKDNLKTYTFVARDQVELKTGTFSLDIAKAQDMIGAHKDTITDVEVKNPVDVTILLEDYTVDVFVDGDIQVEEEKKIKFDGKAHKVEAVANPEARKIEYTITKFDDEGNQVGEPIECGEGEIPAITEEGTYKIDYVVEPVSGFDKIEGSFKLVIEKPTFHVEVDTDPKAHYAEGKKLVLVHTDVQALAFSYGEDGSELPMVDVSSREYWYNDGKREVRKFKYVFGIVVPGLEDGAATLDKYEDLVKYGTRTGNEVVIPEYDFNINMDANGKVDHSDLSVMYGTYNLRTATYADHDYMAHILKADVNGDKTVDGHDIARIVNAVYPVK